MRSTTREERQNILRCLFGVSNLSADDFRAFFQVYDEVANKGGDVVIAIPPTSGSATLTDDHLIQAVNLLKHEPELTRQGAHQAFLRQVATGSQLSSTEVDKVLNLAVHCTIMVDCSAQSSHAADYSLGDYKPVSWQPTERFVDFVKLSLGPDIKLDNGAMELTITKDFKASLKAWKLRKRLGIKFQPTDDLTKHLLLDRRRNVLFIFHHVKFLKTQSGIYVPIQKNLGLTVHESLKRGTLPPQLLVETLHSIQAVLFPPHNKKAARILKRLIANRDTQFDPECARYDGETLPKDFRYIYWAKRIADLNDLLKKRPPRNGMERWLQWQSSEGNALLVAFIALLISIIVGIISIGLSAVQIWISWMAWKHPVESRSDANL